MIWDRVAAFYDLFEDAYNGKVNRALTAAVASYIGPEDCVLECACGTGMLSVAIAPRCAHLTATDYSQGMLRQATRKLAKFQNTELAQADITHLPYPDGSFQKVVAANVIHLLDDPAAALRELERVCKPGGKILIPTYINRQKKRANAAAGLLGKLGIDFKRQFDDASYRAFFRKLGYESAEFTRIEGRMPCTLAVLTKK